MHGKRVLVRIERLRFRCKACGRTLFEPVPAMDDKPQATKRLIGHGEAHRPRKTCAKLPREVGVDDKTARHIFDDDVARRSARVRFDTPEVLGIDELKIVGQYRAMLTNVDRLRLFDMLPTRKKADLVADLKRMPDKRRVKLLTTDLWSVYRQVVLDQFPKTPIVADRFHVERMANDALERVRKSVRQGLTTRERLRLKDDRFVLLSRRDNLSEAGLAKRKAWGERFPLLPAAYEAKDAFHEIYSHPCKEDAQRAAQSWEPALAPQVESAVREVRVALRNWWTEILNDFERPVTNGYAESVNHLAKGLNRMGRGYSFDVIRARLPFDSDAARTGVGPCARKCAAAPLQGLTRPSLRESHRLGTGQAPSRSARSSTVPPFRTSSESSKPGSSTRVAARHTQRSQQDLYALHWGLRATPPLRAAPAGGRRGQ